MAETVAASAVRSVQSVTNSVVRRQTLARVVVAWHAELRESVRLQSSLDAFRNREDLRAARFEEAIRSPRRG